MPFGGFRSFFRRSRNKLPDPNELDQVMFAELKDLGDELELVFASHAPHKTGRLARGIKAQVVGKHVEITVHARNPIGGYDYVGVTRFGHRMEWIYPRGDRHEASVIATRRDRQRGHRAALRFVIGGRVFYRRRVHGYKPAFDWVDKALPEVERSTERAMRNIKLMIEERR